MRALAAIEASALYNEENGIEWGGLDIGIDMDAYSRLGYFGGDDAGSGAADAVQAAPIQEVSRVEAASTSVAASTTSLFSASTAEQPGDAAGPVIATTPHSALVEHPDRVVQALSSLMLLRLPGDAATKLRALECLLDALEAPEVRMRLKRLSFP